MFKKMMYYINDSMERRIPLAIFIVLVLVLGSSFFMLIQRQAGIDNEVKHQNVEQTATLLLRCIDYSMLIGDMDGVQEIIDRAAEDPTIHQVRLFDGDLDEVMTTSIEAQKYEVMDQLSQAHNSKAPVLDTRFLDEGRLGYYDPVIIREDCLDCHDGDIGEVMGVLETDVDTSDLIARYKKNQFFLSFL